MELQEYFSQDYQGCESFIENVIYPIFGKDKFEDGYNVNMLEDDDDLLQIAKRSNVKKILRVGTINIPFSPIEVFDITVKDSTNMAHCRVGIQSLVRCIMDTHSGAFMIFHYENSEYWDWRFTFCEKGGSNKEFISSKRYTYLLGRNQSCRTAAERFGELKKKKFIIEIKDIINAFSVEALTKQFYNELFNWYQWALSDDVKVTYPNDVSTTADDRIIGEHIIRLITRLIFVWFIKQKQLIPDKLFDVKELGNILEDFNPNCILSGNYYNAILQNLFFATLNKERAEREFAKDGDHIDRKEHYGIKTLFRSPKKGTWFKISNDEVLSIFSEIPFLNGGLFECLDKAEINSNGKIIYRDGFSRESDKQKRAFLPNCLFFDPERGIIPLLNKYNFTIEENTPENVNVALDPELLGKVFENLLGVYNPETQETARKQSGSFYTPREVVNYMVDESLIAYLGDNNMIRELFTDNDLSDSLQENIIERQSIADQLKAVKILDPACGSGAFPMGVLNRITKLLTKLNCENKESAYRQKLHLIENCIYGVDIQTIAVQISKLRFFISLICEQDKDLLKDNSGIEQLPNLETKFVCANTLLKLNKKKKGDFIGSLFDNPEIKFIKEELLKIRSKHFSAKTIYEKTECRKQDEKLRDKLINLLQQDSEYEQKEATQLAQWNPYDPNTIADFFDCGWMFGLTGGFDIVIGNPPYIQLQKSTGIKIKNNKGLETDQKYADQYQECNYLTFDRSGDIYCLFYERGCQLLMRISS